jgi:hypothetical protein
MPSILQKAKKIPLPGSTYDPNPPVPKEELEACLAFVRGEISAPQLAKALGKTRTLAYQWVYGRLGRAAKAGQVSITKK